MSLTARNRSILYQRLHELIGDEEAVGEMLSNFATDDSQRPATEPFVAAEIAVVRTEIADVRAEIADVRAEIADVRTEIAGVRAEMATELADVRTEMRTGFAALRGEMAERDQRLMAFVHQEVRSSMRWTLGFLVSSQAVLVAAVVAAG